MIKSTIKAMKGENGKGKDGVKCVQIMEENGHSEKIVVIYDSL